MKIAIIGAGSVGTALAKSLVKAGHDVLIASRDPEDAGGAVASTGAQLAGSNAEAAAASDIVILAVPFTSAPQIASEIAEAAAGKTVVDVSNRMSVGPSGPDIDTTSSNAEELAALLPKSRVVKAFNTLFASKQHDPIADGLQLDGFLAGDDTAAKDEVELPAGLDRPEPDRCRSTRSSSPARGHGFPEHQLEHQPGRLLGVRLEAC